MTRTHRLVVCALLLTLVLLTSCTTMNTERLHIRIQNATDIAIDNFWLGAGSGAGGPGSRSFGAMAAGETTAYRTIKPEFGAYSNYNFLTADGQRFIGSPFAWETFGEVTLAAGYYTFVLAISGDVSTITIVEDAAP